LCYDWVRTLSPFRYLPLSLYRLGKALAGGTTLAYQTWKFIYKFGQSHRTYIPWCFMSSLRLPSGMLIRSPYTMLLCFGIHIADERWSILLQNTISNCFRVFL